MLRNKAKYKNAKNLQLRQKDSLIWHKMSSDTISSYMSYDININAILTVYSYITIPYLKGLV